MKRIVKVLIFFLLIAAYANNSGAGMTTSSVSMYGDFDLLDDSVKSNGADWEKLLFRDGEGHINEVGLTDTWINSGKVAWSQKGFNNFSSINSAFLVIGHAGWGAFGSPEVDLFGEKVGILQTAHQKENLYTIDLFNITVFGDRLLAPNIDLSFLFPENNGNIDAGAIDFSLIAVSGQHRPAAVPIPSTLMLLSSVLGFGIVARNKGKKKQK